MRWAGHMEHVREERKVYRVLMGEPEGKRPLRRNRYGWEDRIRMDLGKLGWRGVDYIQLAQCRGQWQTLLNVVMNL
jgi:hypothetical protein